MKDLLKVRQSLSNSLFNPVEKIYIESLPQKKSFFSLFKMQISLECFGGFFVQFFHTSHEQMFDSLIVIF